MIGAVALALFLRETGISGAHNLKRFSSDDQRNGLSSELGVRAGYNIALQGLDNQRLVLLALQRAAGFEIGESLSLLKNRLLVDEEEQEELVHNAGSCTCYVDPWTSVGDRLVWVTKLLTAASTAGDASQKQLAALLYKPAIMALNNHRNGLDFFGRDEWFTEGEAKRGVGPNVRHNRRIRQEAQSG
jgi:hypothetical protein